MPAAILANASLIWMASSRVGAQNDGPNAGLSMGSGLRDFRRDVMDDGQDKRERLAGAGLRGGDQIAASQRRLNGQLLDGRRLDKTVLG